MAPSSHREVEAERSGVLRRFWSPPSYPAFDDVSQPTREVSLCNSLSYA